MIYKQIHGGFVQDKWWAYPGFAIAMLSVLINFTVLYTLKNHRPQLKSDPSLKIFFSLAICDLLAGICTFFNSFICFYPQVTNVSNHATYKVRVGAIVFESTAEKTIILHLCLIGYNHYVKVQSTFRYHEKISDKRLKIMVLSVWIISFLFALVPLIWLSPVMTGKISRKDKEFLFVNINDVCFSMSEVVIFGLIPVVYLGFVFTSLTLNIRKTWKRQRKSLMQNRQKIFAFSNQELIAAKSFLINFLPSLVLIVPYFVMRMVIDIQYLQNRNVEILFTTAVTIIMKITYHLKCSVSVANPLLYNLRSQQFRKMFSVLVNIKSNENETRV